MLKRFIFLIIVMTCCNGSIIEWEAYSETQDLWEQVNTMTVQIKNLEQRVDKLENKNVVKRIRA